MKTKVKFYTCYAHDGTEYHDIYALVHWPSLEPYWAKDDTGIPDRSKLLKYQPQWFDKDGCFEPADIYWNERLRSISIANGRHRIATISKHQPEVPVFIDGEMLLNPIIYQSIIRILTPDSEITLPDLEIQQYNFA